MWSPTSKRIFTRMRGRDIPPVLPTGDLLNWLGGPPMTAADTRNWMWDEACSMLERAERLQRQFFQPNPTDSRTPSWQPPVDVFETGRDIWIIAALPGVESQDLEISIADDTVIIAGVRRLPAAARGAMIHRLEIPHGRFERRIRLAATPLTLTRSELASGCLVLGLTKQRP
jgi:HSP20 family protein